MAARLTRPISSIEFKRALLPALPPIELSETLVVANSGGPDSTCLLFLLDRYLKEGRDTRRWPNSLPRRLLSLSIDHNLQSSSALMAAQAANIASSLGIEHNTSKLAWGLPGNPPKPGPGNKIEEVARDMRLKTFLDVMSRFKANGIAMGHHEDDQVETMLMRLGRNASSSGLAGMKPCRRWGMGDRSQEYGIEGMRKWILRPLLSFPKDRIIATCDENSLDYVQDTTNFQPQLTTRNAIRHILGMETRTRDDALVSSMETLPAPMAQQLREIQEAAENCNLPFDLTSENEQLRQQSRSLRTKEDERERAVDSIISRHRLPSPPGTFMMPCSAFQEIRTAGIETNFLYRITRYVSPGHWGHPRAQLGRSQASVNRLANHLWNFEHLARVANNSICCGSQVWWKMVRATDARVRAGLAVGLAKPDELAWIASRQPPQKRDLPNAIGHLLTSMRAPERLGPLKPGFTGTTELLYDNRFILRFHWDKILPKFSGTNGEIIISSNRPWFLPEVTFRNGTIDELVQTEIQWPDDWRRLFKYDRPEVRSNWIEIQYIRPISEL